MVRLFKTKLLKYFRKTLMVSGGTIWKSMTFHTCGIQESPA